MQQLNKLQDWETEMDRLERIHRDIYRLRGELRAHEMYEAVRFLAVVGCICAAWYFRVV